MPTSSLTVVVPADNEQETIAPFTRALAAALPGEEYAVLANRPDPLAIEWQPVRSPETGQIARLDGRTPRAR